LIQYSLHCAQNHEFDAWFKSAAAFDEQHERGIVTCPVCGSSAVEKAVMAPAVARSAPDSISLSSGHHDQANMLELLRRYRRKVMSEAENVGDRFADEARKIHFDEAPARGIYGKATRDEVDSLIEDGVDFLPLPDLPEEHN